MFKISHVLGLALTLVGLALAPTAFANDESPPATLPPELLTGPIHGVMPSDLEPQSRADLERTRDELYGQVLTADQHDQIDGWRPSSIGWWRDHDHMERAHQLRADLSDHLAGLSGSLTTDAVRTAFLAHDDAFGGHIVPIVEQSAFGNDNAGVPAKAFRVEIDARTRPDFFAFDVAVADLVSLLLQLRSEEPQAADALFYEIFPSLAASEDVGDLALIADFWQNTEAFHRQRALVVSGARAQAIRPAIDQYQDQDGLGFDVAAFQSLSRAATNAQAVSSRQQMEVYLNALPDVLSKELQSFLVNTYLPNRVTALTYLSAEGAEETVFQIQRGWAKR